MSHQKPRPNDGPGANGLRGGKNVYSSKTAINSWLEEHAALSTGYRRGFTTPEFETEAQHAQLGVIAKPIPKFGSAVIAPARKANTKDSYQSVDANPNETWKSNYNIMTEELMKHKVGKLNYISIESYLLDKIKFFNSS